MSDFDDDQPDERPRPSRPAGTKGGRPRGSVASDRGDRAEPAPAPVKDADDWDDDDDDDRTPGAGRRDLTLILGIVAAVAIIALVVVLTRPSDDDKDTKANPPAANGQPATGETTLPNKNWEGPVAEGVGADAEGVKERVAKEAGLYIWTDFNGWHLRNTTDGSVTVTVAAETVVASDAAGKPDGEPGTSVTVEVPKGDADTGVDLDLGGSTEATFTVKDASGGDLPAEDINLGGKSGKADQNPVVFNKT